MPCTTSSKNEPDSRGIDPAVTANAYVDQWGQSAQVAERLCESLDGTGRIFAMLLIAGSSAAVTQLAALENVLESDARSDIELASVEYGDWNRAKAKQLTENLLQRFTEIDGVFSPAGQMSMGVVVGTRYLEPEEAAEMYQPHRPDDWWPSDLPEEFLPQ
jgi:ABC-type sugar transport system substrate-binding protein